MLGETALNIFEELGVSINPSEIEAFHLAQLFSWKKVIIKMSWRKDADTVIRAKKTLKGTTLESLEVGNLIFINKSFCSYSKLLWPKCKRLWINRCIGAKRLRKNRRKRKLQTLCNQPSHRLRKYFLWKWAPRGQRIRILSVIISTCCVLFPDSCVFALHSLKTVHFLTFKIFLSVLNSVQ